MTKMIAATQNEVAILTPAAEGWRVSGRSLEGHQITSVIAREGVMIVGTRTGLLRSADWGQSWQEINTGLTIPHIRWLAYHPEISDFEIAGTEPAGIFISRDGGDHWEGIAKVEALRDQFGWWLPYSPEAGCVRDFALQGDFGYAAVEVGGVLCSSDRGQTWGLAAGSTGQPIFDKPQPGYVHADVHAVKVHPSNPQLVFAMTNMGTYRSEDAGARWSQINDYGYTRAGWIDPANPQYIMIGPAKGVGRFGTILETADGGRHWQPLTTGSLAPWENTMVERFSFGADRLWAVLSNGELFHLAAGNKKWQPVAAISGVNAITQMED